MTLDEQFMQLALRIAASGCGFVEPNPMVGAVIVRDGKEIARGHHRQFGGPHAEVEAIRAAQAAKLDLRGATLYVTLEPCCPFDKLRAGQPNKKTPPCTEAIIPENFARVVIAMSDPDENVSDRGIAQLRAAGISVDVDICEPQARTLLAPYIKLRTQHRPWVICKWAQTTDGYLALPTPTQQASNPPRPGGKGPAVNHQSSIINHKSPWVSNELSRAYVHELRGRQDAILVGINTILQDNPLLTNRGTGPRHPTRIVLDSQLRTPLESELIRTAAQAPILLCTTTDAVGRKADQATQLRTAGVELLELPPGEDGIDATALLNELAARQFTYLFVEGGQHVLQSLIHGGLADELIVFTSPQTVADAPADLPHFDIASISDIPNRDTLKLIEERMFGTDTMRRYYT